MVYLSSLIAASLAATISVSGHPLSAREDQPFTLKNGQDVQSLKYVAVFDIDWTGRVLTTSRQCQVRAPYKGLRWCTRIHIRTCTHTRTCTYICVCAFHICPTTPSRGADGGFWSDCRCRCHRRYPGLNAEHRITTADEHCSSFTFFPAVGMDPFLFNLDFSGRTESTDMQCATFSVIYYLLSKLFLRCFVGD